ncbi:unnamed protein product [Caenorhabditis auriculariae]|uniref:Uncharacterized protein n=1 Tax=Caenorhabditis auriculariae TaxID=2777116 RepID=A0A8S1GR93_9PELO|nr:unnamed protein product [Caenorhabditis auriculariae]
MMAHRGILESERVEELFKRILLKPLPLLLRSCRLASFILVINKAHVLWSLTSTTLQAIMSIYEWTEQRNLLRWGLENLRSSSMQLEKLVDGDKVPATSKEDDGAVGFAPPSNDALRAA